MSQPIAAGWYHIQAVHSGKWLTVAVPKSNHDDSAYPIWQVEWINGIDPTQRWYFHKKGDKHYVIESQKFSEDNRVFTIENGSISNNAKLICGVKQGKGEKYQQFKVEKVGDFRYQFIAAHSKKVLDVPESSMDDYVQLIQYSDYDTTNQMFNIMPVLPPSNL
mmetsp:Transcript_59925/g.53927  ORF Transcript_59925/g.53927 Transcript_59925/m.53927 type:complete len:163 (-) Transcript_59925:15-503(-)